MGPELHDTARKGARYRQRQTTTQNATDWSHEGTTRKRLGSTDCRSARRQAARHDWSHEIVTRKRLAGTEFQPQSAKGRLRERPGKRKGTQESKMRVQEQDARRKFQISRSRDRSPEGQK